MKTIAYLRVSKDSQDTDNQKYSILNYGHLHNFHIDEFLQISISSRKNSKERKIDELLKKLAPGDRLIVSELSRLGRSVGEIIRIVDHLIKEDVNLVAIKEGIVLSGKGNMQTKIMVTMFSLFAEIERDLISERTKQGLLVARAKGKKLGRPKGSFNSQLDSKEEEIRNLLGKKVSKASISKILNVSPSTLSSFIKLRKITS